MRTWGEGLVRFGEGTRILPELAERWEIDPSGTLYTFHLRRGVRWHEGGTLAAADVKASFERFLSPATARSARDPLRRARGVRRLPRGADAGRRRPRGSVQRPVPRPSRRAPSPSSSSSSRSRTSPSSRRPSSPTRRACAGCPSGTGPFVPREITFGKTARFDRSDAYWDRGRIALDGVDLDLTEDSEAGVFQRFLDGQLDVVWDIPYPEAARLMADPEWRPYIDSSVQLHTSFLVLRCDRAPLDDVRVRRALNHAVDRAALNERTFAGLTVPAASSCRPTSSATTRPSGPYRHDPERARALLHEAGCGDGLTLSAWLSPKDARDPLNPLPVVAAQLEAVGVEARPRGPSRRGDVRAESGAASSPTCMLSRWFADFPDPDTFFSSLFYSKTEDVLDGGFRNAEVDRLVEKGARLLDAAEREAVYRDLNRLVQAEAPVVFLFHNRGFVRPGSAPPRRPGPPPAAPRPLERPLARALKAGETRTGSPRRPSAPPSPPGKTTGPACPEGRTGPRAAGTAGIRRRSWRRPPPRSGRRRTP